jgi:threonine/homoserine/homoserine lactone efflux protein
MSFFIFAVAHLLAVLSPGPTILGMTNFTLNNGFRNALQFVIGTALANIIIAFVAVFGVSAILQNNVFNGIFHLFSGGYLMYFSFQLFYDKTTKQGLQINKNKVFWTGFIIRVLNPKSLLFAISLVAIVITPQSSLMFKYFIAFWFVFITAFYGIIVIWFVDLFRIKVNNALKILNKIFAVILFLFGWKLIIDGIIIFIS